MNRIRLDIDRIRLPGVDGERGHRILALVREGLEDALAANASWEDARPDRIDRVPAGNAVAGGSDHDIAAAVVRQIIQAIPLQKPPGGGP